MSILTADIVEFLKNNSTSIANLSRETGIPSYNLYKWRKGEGEPSGDNCIKLYEIVKHSAETQDENYDHVNASVTIQRLERQLDALVQTNLVLATSVMTALNNIVASLPTGVTNSERNLQSYKNGILERTRKTEAGLSEAEREMISRQIDEQGQG